MEIVKRIIGSPFVLCIVLIANILLSFKVTLNFLKYGGEFIAYTNKNERKTIASVYYAISKKSTSKKQ